MSLERRLLSRLTDPAEIARIWEMGLKAEAFEDSLNRIVYNFVIDYWLSSQMVTAPTAFAIETECPPFCVDTEVEEESWWLATQLMKRQVVNTGQEMVRSAMSTLAVDPIDTIKKLQVESYAAIETVVPRHSRSNMRDFEARRRRYQQEKEGRGTGLTLGLNALDDHTDGLRPGELCVIGAYSKVGKTMFLLHAAAAARKAGHTPLVFTLEMPIDEIEDRIDAIISGVSYNRLSKRKLDVQELKRLYWCQEAMAEMGDVDVESPEDGERTVAYLTARARHSGVDYLIIDQLSEMEAVEGHYPTEKMRVGSILKQLKNEIGRESRGKLSCLLACQLNRESLDRVDGPIIKDFADAAEVERKADLLLALSRNQEMQTNQTMRLDILGSRRCDRAKWLLQWNLTDRTHIDVMERITG